MPLGMNPIKAVGEWLVTALTSQLTQPIKDLQAEVAGLADAQSDLARLVEQKHADDPTAKECDLSLLDERICYLISKCLEKGYTTELDRRIVSRLHEAYKARGGNHGEEKMYDKFCMLPTEEEWRRANESDQS